MCKPTTRTLVTLVLVAALAFVSWLVAIGLSIVKTRTGMDGTIPGAAYAVAIASSVIAFQLGLRYGERYDDAVDRSALYAQQARVETRLDRVLEDTGAIPRLATAVVDAPEIIVLKVSDQHFQEVDRESARQVLAEAQARQARHEAEAAEVSYIDRYHDMHRGPRAVPDAD
jgi:hypothetical protein